MLSVGSGCVGRARAHSGLEFLGLGKKQISSSSRLQKYVLSRNLATWLKNSKHSEPKADIFNFGAKTLDLKFFLSQTSTLT